MYGPVLTVIGCFGLLGNTLSIIVFTRSCMKNALNFILVGKQLRTYLPNSAYTLGKVGWFSNKNVTLIFLTGKDDLCQQKRCHQNSSRIPARIKST